MGLFGNKDVKRVVRAKVIGVRTAENSGMLTTYNYGVYSLLIEYDNGARDIVEAKLGSKEMAFYIDYIEW